MPERKHGPNWELIINRREVLGQMNENISAAMHAMGQRAVKLIVNTMQHGFAKRIWKTGDLQGDVAYGPGDDEKTIRVGNSLDYAVWVHEGTHKMAARPYITKALEGKEDELARVAAPYLAQGFEGGASIGGVTISEDWKNDHLK